MIDEGIKAALAASRTRGKILGARGEVLWEVQAVPEIAQVVDLAPANRAPSPRQNPPRRVSGSLLLIMAASSLCSCRSAGHPPTPPPDAIAIMSVPAAVGDAGQCGIGNGVAEQALVAAARSRNPDGVSLLTQQASTGNLVTELFLSRLYLKGTGVRPDPVRSRALLEDAAQHRQPLAQGLLGRDFVYGWDGFEKQPPKGMALLKASALSGCVVAEAELGQIYTSGDSVPRDSAEGLVWYSLAAAHNNADAEVALGDHYYYGDDPRSDNDDFTPDYSAARFWYERSAASGSPLGEVALGDLLSDSAYHGHNLKLAAAAYGVAAKDGDAGAEFSLGDLRSRPGWSGQNVDQAYQYYRLAALNGDDWKRKDAIVAIYRILNRVSAGVRQQFPPPLEPLNLRIGRYGDYTRAFLLWGLFALFAIPMALAAIAAVIGLVRRKFSREASSNS